MATTYVGYTDTAGMRILTRESNVRYIIRRPTGKYLINVLGNKVWNPSNNNVVYSLIALPIGVAFVDGVTEMIIHTHVPPCARTTRSTSCTFSRAQPRPTPGCRAQ